MPYVLHLGGDYRLVNCTKREIGSVNIWTADTGRLFNAFSFVNINPQASARLLAETMMFSKLSFTSEIGQPLKDGTHQCADTAASRLFTP